VHLVFLSTLFFAYALLFLDLGPELLGAVGKDPTLTGRTELWGFISDLVQDPLLGSGFESFWLGDRLAYLAQIYWWRPNEAHNGYFEVYLNLGWIGVTLLAVVIVTGYRKIVGGLYRDADGAGLRAAFFVATLVYGLTEAAFRVMSPIWFVFVLAIVGSAADITAPKTTNENTVLVQAGDQQPFHQIEGNPRGG
jgi:O-antigen ligase